MVEMCMNLVYYKERLKSRSTDEQNLQNPRKRIKSVFSQNGKCEVDRLLTGILL